MFADLSAGDIETLLRLLGQDQGLGAQGHRQWEGRDERSQSGHPAAQGLRAARHVRLAVDGKVATITLDRPDKKNPLTFDSYAELADLFRAGGQRKKPSRRSSSDGAGGSSSPGGDVFEIIEPLVKMATG